ncbi:MAG: sulfur transferase domain-containing protein [Pseudomonadota bacterium]
MIGFLVALYALAAAPEVSVPYQWQEDVIQAPTGDAGVAFVRNYVRVTPYIAVGGRLSDDGVDRAKDVGFNMIIDLRQPDEQGVAEEEARAAELGVAYRRLSMPREAAEVEAFMPDLIAALENADNYPILLHCASGNRAGGAWALYRGMKGVPAVIAIEEGRAAGMRSREAVVREVLASQ